MSTSSHDHHYYCPPGRELSPGVVMLASYPYTFPPASGRFCSPYWVLDYSLCAFGRVRVGAATRPFRPRPAHCGHLYPPGTPYWEETAPDGARMRSCYLVFRGGEELGLTPFVANREGYARLRDPRGRLGRLLRNGAREACLAGANGWLRAQACLYRVAEMLQGLARGGEEGTWRIDSGSAAPEDDAAWARRVRSALQRDLAGKIRLADVAAEMACGVSALTRRYRRATGETLGQTLVALRLHAAELLLRHNYPLKAVAERTGFYDEFHLSKAFRRVKGLSPRVYRRRANAARSAPAPET